MEKREGGGKYLKMACAKSQHSLNIAKSIDDERMFPFTIKTAAQMWNNMVTRAGAPYNERDTRTGRHKYHIHSLRKYFRTQLSLGTGNPDIAETLMGHKGYLTDSYRSIPEK